MTNHEADRASSVAAYDAARRAAAREAGRPLRRTAAPGIIGNTSAGSVDDVLVWLDERGVLRSRLRGGDQRVARVTARTVDKALVMPEPGGGTPMYPDLERPRRLVVANEHAMRALLGAAEGWAKRSDGGPSVWSLPFRLRLALGLVASTRVVVLTRALARQYWLPAGLDEASVQDWARAFRIGTGPVEYGVVERLVAAALEGSVDPRWARSALLSESSALRSAIFRSLRAAVTVYERATSADAATRAILTTDPLLLERGTLDGSAARLWILNVYDGTFTASVSRPFRLRAGKPVLLIDPEERDPGQAAQSVLLGMRVESVGGQEQVTVRVKGSVRAGRLSRLVETVSRRAGREMYVVEAPYLPRRSDGTAQRWTASAGARCDGGGPAAQRDVPLDVVIAGVPQVGL